jgi:predicted PurR-regulated permease PerM
MTLSAAPEARARAGQRWRLLKERLQSISPQALTRAAMGVGIVIAAGWLAAASWPALAPFLVGAIIAYAVLPIANRLDAFMPRVLAALLAELVAVAILIGVVAVVLPPLITGIGAVVDGLPTEAQLEQWAAQIQQQLGTMPEPMRTITVNLLTQVSANIQAVLQGFLDQIAQIVTNQILGVVGTLSTLLGLLVIPAWVLTMVADERTIKRQGARIFAPAVRADVYALFRIVDRALSTFLRVRLLLAIVAGLLIYIGLSGARELGIGEFRFGVAAAVLLGALQLIPELGFFIGFFPLLLALPSGGPDVFVVSLLVYWASVKLASMAVETRVSRGVLDVHPGLLIPAIVVLSQFGFLWLLAAAPIVAITRDLVRYANGRLGDPATPAGLLPGERRKAAGNRAAIVAAGAAVPAVYRRSTAPPPSVSRRAPTPVGPTATATGAPASRATGAGTPAVVPATALASRATATSTRTTTTTPRSLQP